jgi:hypothetical protein
MVRRHPIKVSTGRGKRLRDAMTIEGAMMKRSGDLAIHP